MSRVASTCRALMVPSTAPTSRTSARPSSRVPSSVTPRAPTPPPPTASPAPPPALAAPALPLAPVPLLPTARAWPSAVSPPSSTPLLNSCRGLIRVCGGKAVSCWKDCRCRVPSSDGSIFALHCCSHDNNSVFSMRKIRNLDSVLGRPRRRHIGKEFFLHFFITPTRVFTCLDMFYSRAHQLC